MEDLISLVIALASELAQQGHRGEPDPALVERTKSATRRLYGAMEDVPPPLRRQVQRIVRDSATIIGNAERRLGVAAPPAQAPRRVPVPDAVARPAPQPVPTAPPVAQPKPRPSEAPIAVAPPALAIDPEDVQRGIVWATILGQPRSLDPGW